MIAFPTLTRKPALKTRDKVLDATLRDNLDNGMESTRARFTRQRREWDVTIDLLTPDDRTALDEFVDTGAVQGVNIFTFPDDRNPKSPQTYQVRFAVLPSFTDVDNGEDGVRYNTTFTLREV